MSLLGVRHLFGDREWPEPYSGWDRVQEEERREAESVRRRADEERLPVLHEDEQER